MSSLKYGSDVSWKEVVECKRLWCLFYIRDSHGTTLTALLLLQLIDAMYTLQIVPRVTNVCALEKLKTRILGM